MVKTLNPTRPIYYRGKLVKFVKWETLTPDKKIKVRLTTKFIEVDFTELPNEE